MDNGAMEMLGTALEMEAKGMEFYEKAITSCSNELGREIFTTLRNDEILHVKRIKEIYSGLKGGEGFTGKWQQYRIEHKDLGLMFREMAFKHGKSIKADTGDLDALEIGLDFENKSVIFYQERLQKVGGPMEYRFIEEMVREERSHYDILADMKFYLSDPGAWFAEKERSSFDGA